MTTTYIEGIQCPSCKALFTMKDLMGTRVCCHCGSKVSLTFDACTIKVTTPRFKITQPSTWFASETMERHTQ